jgi:hypothetical protein
MRLVERAAVAVDPAVTDGDVSGIGSTQPGHDLGWILPAGHGCLP